MLNIRRLQYVLIWLLWSSLVLFRYMFVPEIMNEMAPEVFLHHLSWKIIIFPLQCWCDVNPLKKKCNKQTDWSSLSKSETVGQPAVKILVRLHGCEAWSVAQYWWLRSLLILAEVKLKYTQVVVVFKFSCYFMISAFIQQDIWVENRFVWTSTCE